MKIFCLNSLAKGLKRKKEVSLLTEVRKGCCFCSPCCNSYCFCSCCCSRSILFYPHFTYTSLLYLSFASQMTLLGFLQWFLMLYLPRDKYLRWSTWQQALCVCVCVWERERVCVCTWQWSPRGHKHYKFWWCPGLNLGHLCGRQVLYPLCHASRAFSICWCFCSSCCC